MNVRLLPAAGIVVGLLLVWRFVGAGTNASFEEARNIILFRQIGHEFLLSAGDSTSRVLPIRKMSGTEYLVEFENPFAFKPDSLVRVVDRIMKRNPVQVKYIVNVIDGKNHEVVYGFSGPQEAGTIPCTGRFLPKNRYSINILLSADPVSQAFQTQRSYALIIDGLLAGFLLMIVISAFRRKTSLVKETVTEPPSNSAHSTSIPIGKYLFFSDKQLLVLEDEQIELTAKESRLLSIFAGRLNLVIDRNQLLKEGWEDEGVITGRSLDVYVSKLRKKLEKDPSVSIANIHGKGYRLMSS